MVLVGTVVGAVDSFSVLFLLVQHEDPVGAVVVVGGLPQQPPVVPLVVVGNGSVPCLPQQLSSVAAAVVAEEVSPHSVALPKRYNSTAP